MKARINKVRKISLDLISSNVDHVNYYLSTKNMVVKYHSGSRYKYLNVPMTEAYRLLSSKSKGKFVNSVIKKHEFIKLS